MAAASISQCAIAHDCGWRLCTCNVVEHCACSIIYMGCSSDAAAR